MRWKFDKIALRKGANSRKGANLYVRNSIHKCIEKYTLPSANQQLSLKPRWEQKYFKVVLTSGSFCSYNGLFDYSRTYKTGFYMQSLPNIIYKTKLEYSYFTFALVA